MKKKHLPKDQRVQLSNKREEFFDIFRQEKAVQKVKSSPVPYHLLGNDASLLEKINLTMIETANIIISLNYISIQ